MRNKKPINKNQDIEMKARHICEDFKEFTDGIRLLMLIHRSKEGAQSANNDKLAKLISNNSREFEDNLYELLVRSDLANIGLRIYSAVNPRNISKAIRKFKFEVLESDYYDQESKERFYLDINNRFIGCLMSPQCADDSQFIIDVDSQKDLDSVLMKIAEAGLNDKKIKQYPTKNGWHIVMKAFNPKLFGEYESLIHKDSLLLLDY